MDTTLITPTTSAVAASAATELTVAEGKVVNVCVDAGIGSEVIEIKQKIGGNYLSITDPEDATDTTKKVLSATNRTRHVYGPCVVAIDKPTTASATGVYCNFS